MARQYDHGKGAGKTDQIIELTMEHPETPFPRHWLYYLAIKLVVLAIAVAATLRYFGYW